MIRKNRGSDFNLLLTNEKGFDMPFEITLYTCDNQEYRYKITYDGENYSENVVGVTEEGLLARIDKPEFGVGQLLMKFRTMQPNTEYKEGKFITVGVQPLDVLITNDVDDKVDEAVAVYPIVANIAGGVDGSHGEETEQIESIDNQTLNSILV